MSLFDIVYDVVYDIVYDTPYTISYTISYTIFCFLFDNVIFVWKVHMINTAITKAKPGSSLYQKPFVNDHSERLIETHVAASHAVQVDSGNLEKAAGHVCIPPRTFETKSTCQKWRGRRMEIREGTQYSSQGAQAHPLWLV